MRVVCISDTHGLHDALQRAQRIPDGDVLIHAGDFTDTGDRDEVLAFNEFLGKLPHKYKLVVAGNHESTFDRAFYPFNWQQYGHRQQYDPDEVRALLTNGLYLEDQAVLIDGFKFYGTPWQPEFCNWAFNLPRGEKLLEKWRLIPSDTDVLITHTPPFGRGDKVGYLNVGCEELTREVTERIQPQFHVFGHVHEGYGKSSDGTTVFMNASACTHDYEAINPAFVFDLKVSKSGNAAATCSQNDGGIVDTTKVLEYALMLHEQLRVCSQKVPFVSKPLWRSASEEQNGDCVARRKQSLREFRVDGTTSGLLLESTLKLRPVVGEQTRALRYLFHNGLNGHAGGLTPGKNGGDTRVVAGGADHSAKEGQEEEDTKAQDPAASSRAARRRQSTIMRRVTMAVLNDVSESKELTGAEIQELESSASTLMSSSDASDTNGKSGKNSATGRVRRNKTLQRREGRVRLASMPEEPEEKQQQEQQLQTQETRAEPAVSTVPVKEDPVEPPPPAAPVVECVLCKYKVSGHIHLGSEPTVVVDPPAVATADGNSTQPSGGAAEAEQEKPSNESERQKTMSAKRLSSWF